MQDFTIYYAAGATLLMVLIASYFLFSKKVEEKQNLEEKEISNDKGLDPSAFDQSMFSSKDLPSNTTPPPGMDILTQSISQPSGGMPPNFQQQMMQQQPGGGLEAQKAAADLQEKYLKGGSTNNYNWTQTDESVEIIIPISKETKSKDVKVVIEAKKLKCLVCGILKIEGGLFKEVVVDDSTYCIDERKGVKSLTITLFKRKKTTSTNDHWQYVVPNEGQVFLGPPVFTIDPNDKEGIKKVIESMNTGKDK